MAGANRSPQIVRFGIFEADLRSGELRKNGMKVPLQGQPFQVCAILLMHSGALVTREELRQKVWPEDTFVDFDHALKNRFVETLPRRGYRFIGPLADVNPTDAKNLTALHQHGRARCRGPSAWLQDRSWCVQERPRRPWLLLRG